MIQKMETLHVDLPHDQVWALAEFLKRVGWAEIRACAVDDAEASEIQAALATLAATLKAEGFVVR